MFADRTEITKDDRKEILLKLFEDYRAHILHIDGAASKLTLAVCTGLLMFPTLLADRLKSLSVISASGATVLLVGITGTTLWTLHCQRRHYLWLCRAIVRLKQALGLFEERLYFDSNKFLHDKYTMWDESDFVAPLNSQKWGQTDWLATYIAYIAATIICCLGSSLMLWGIVLK